eukprot:GHVP01023072.1.p1 GENE.GHVP01023072.1~~GHVP01023072.1.p1  ORF type:complete len:134 (-),score=20.38 GHVP01023072.1:4-405(-)
MVDKVLTWLPYKERNLDQQLYNHGRNANQTSWASDILDSVFETRKKIARMQFPVPEHCQEFTNPPDVDQAKEIIYPYISKRIDGADGRNPFEFCYWKWTVYLRVLVGTRIAIYENLKKLQSLTFESYQVGKLV